MRAALLGFLSLCLLLGPLAVNVSAAPSTGDLSFDATPRIDGRLEVSGSGEVPLHANVPASLAGTGTLTLTRVWTEETVLANPLGGGDIRADTPDSRTEEVPIGAAAFALDATGAAFRGLLFTEPDGRLDGSAERVEDVQLAAFRAPELVVDDYGETREGETGVFTYRADGDRFPFIVDQVAATGAFTAFLFDAELVVTGQDGSQARYVSGSTREEQPGGTVRVVHEHHLLHVTDGSAAVDADALLAWLAEPTLTVDGRLRADAASGRVEIDNEAHSLDSVAVTLAGTFELRPVPVGDPVPQDDGRQHVGTSAPSEGRYTASRGAIDGDMTAFAIGNRQLLAGDGDAPLVAAAGVVGVAGAMLLLVPKVQWALAGLFAPLYAKTQRDRLLDNASRDRIFQAIRTNPGINLSQVNRLVDLGWGVTVYHLKMLEKNGLIVSESSARDRCFFENDPRFLELRKAIATIANREPVQRIVQTVVDAPGLNQGEVIAATGLTQRTVSYYLGRLAKEGLVETQRVKNYVHYEPTERLRRALDVVASDEVRPVAQGTPLAVPA